MTGAVLAGGKSVRFGKNKALEVFEGMRFVERAVASLRPFCDPVIVVVNELALYADLGVTLVRDVLPHQGPLGGIYTALLFSEAEWIFVKATDMPFLVPEMASLMIGAREGFDAVVPKRNDFHEPLLALYNRRCLPAIARQLETDERQIVRFYRKIKVRSIPEEQWRTIDPEAVSFRNVNTPQDLAELKWT
ncbi:MAG: molybdenum cofactor guanylyltransferase [Syntrophobacteraceae bacterium]